MKDSGLIRPTTGTLRSPLGGWKTLWGGVRLLGVGEEVGGGPMGWVLCIPQCELLLKVTAFLCAKYMPVLFFSPLASLSRTLRVIASFPCLLPWSHLRKTDRRHGKSGCVAEPNADPAWVLLMFARLSQRCRYPVRSTHTLLALYRTVSLLPRHLCGVFLSLAFSLSLISIWADANLSLWWCLSCKNRLPVSVFLLWILLWCKI